MILWFDEATFKDLVIEISEIVADIEKVKESLAPLEAKLLEKKALALNLLSLSWTNRLDYSDIDISVTLTQPTESINIDYEKMAYNCPLLDILQLSKFQLISYDYERFVKSHNPPVSAYEPFTTIEKNSKQHIKISKLKKWKKK